MNRHRLFKHLPALALAAFLPSIHAFAGNEIRLDYVHYFPDQNTWTDSEGKTHTQPALVDTKRHYTLPLDDNPLHDIEFVAERLPRDGTWILNFTIGKPLNGRVPGEKPDYDTLDKIPDKEKLVLACLDRFLADVPGARVCLVETDLRLHNKLWAGFHDRMATLFKSKRAETDPDFGDYVEKMAITYYAQSPIAKDFAAAIAKKCNAKIDFAEFSCEHMLYENASTTSWAGQTKSPYLGMILDYMAFAIQLKPAVPAKK